MPGKTPLLVKISFLAALLLTLLGTESVAHERMAAREPEAMIAGSHAALAQRSYGSAAKNAAIMQNFVQLRLQKRIAKTPVAPTPRAATKVAPSPRPPTFLGIVDQPDIRLEHKVIADEVLRMIPNACRSTLKNFYVRYDNPKQRGLAGKSSVVVSGNLSAMEFRGVLVHELLGHVVDLGCIVGHSESGESGFKDGKEPMYADDPSVAFYKISWLTEHVQSGDANAQDFVTGYASWDSYEDLAESVTYYLLQESAFRERAQTNSALQRKLTWLETNLFTKQKRIAIGSHTWTGEVPWDATKLPYTWLGNQTVAQLSVKN